MLTRRIIPCLDVRDGRVVKGVRFASLRDMGDPAACAAAYQDQGADEIVLLDVGATGEGRAAHLRTVEAVRAALAVPLTVGGGVRTVADARALLAAGADKVSVNSAAVARPPLLAELAAEFGAQCTVIAVDARRTPLGWTAVTHSGKHDAALDAVDWCASAASLGAGEILLTSWDRDGTGAGYDLDLIAAVRARVNVPIVASGGAAGPADVVAALAAGADAALAAGIFHDGRFSVRQVKSEASLAGLEMRP